MHQRVSDLLQRGGAVIYTTPRTPVSEAVRQMAGHNVSSILVMEHGRTLRGIFTERDLLRRVVLAGRDPATTPIEEVMTRDVFVVRPDTSRQDLLQLMERQHIRHVPVADEHLVLGVLSLRDVLRFENAEKDFEIEQLRQYLHQSPPDGRLTA